MVCDNCIHQNVCFEMWAKPLDKQLKEYNTNYVKCLEYGHSCRYFQEKKEV